MNILHHKSWHVRTKKNIEKVRKDEQKALEDEIVKSRRANIAEQERRIQQLRNINVKGDELKSDDDFKKSVNYFDTNQDYSKNLEHELEKKKEQEEWEKKNNILIYLGGSQVNSNLPWYEKSSVEQDKLTYKKTQKIDFYDPLNQIKSELNKKKIEEEKLNILNKIKKNYNFKKEFSLNQNNLINKTNFLDEKAIKLTKLREQRLKREAKEKEKSYNLLNKKGIFNYVLDERNQTYNNQFNPHLAKNKL